MDTIRDRSRSNQRNQNNTYNYLNNDVMEHELVNVSSQNTFRFNQRSIPNKSNTRIPPIVVFDLNITSLRSKMSLIKNIDHNKLNYKITQHGHYIYTSNVNDFKTVKKHCIDNKFNFHTHQLDEEKRIKFCMYGLWKMDKSELRNEFNRLGIQPNDIYVLDIKNKRHDEHCIWVLQFLKGSKTSISDLRQIRGIFNVRVRFEYFNKNSNSDISRGPTMCSRCQDYNHGAENCNRPPKCVRCGDNHESSKCIHIPKVVDEDGNQIENPDPKIPQNKVKCANCNGPHTANFRDCPKRIEIIQLRSAVQNKKPVFKPRMAPNINDSNIFQPLPPTGRPIGNNSWKNTESLSNKMKKNYSNSQDNDLFSAKECYNIMNILISRLKNCHTKADQLRVIGEVTFQFLFDDNNGFP